MDILGVGDEVFPLLILGPSVDNDQSSQLPDLSPPMRALPPPATVQATSMLPLRGVVRSRSTDSWQSVGNWKTYLVKPRPAGPGESG